MKAPAGDPGDFGIAQCAESTLFIPEIAKSAGTPKRVQHVSPFAFFEVGRHRKFHRRRSNHGPYAVQSISL
jgi:hypothetical protein